MAPTELEWGAYLLLLDVTLKSGMSLLRVSGAKGQGNSSSFFERFAKVQLLTTEYAAPGAALFGLLYLQRFSQAGGSPPDDVSPHATAIKAFVGARALFALRSLDYGVNAFGYDVVNGPGLGSYVSPLGLIGATTAYISYAYLAATLAGLV